MVSGCGNKPPWPYVVSVGGVEVNVEVVTTDDARHQGLMERKSLDDDWGMLFVFATEKERAFWMHNTPLPLSIAYFGADCTASDFQDMQPETDDTHPSKGPMLYALEVNQGWFTRHGIKPGAKVAFSPELAQYIKAHPAEND